MKYDRLYKDINKRLVLNMSSTNFLEIYTLHLIKNNRPMYGLEIIKNIRKIYTKEIWYPSHSTLYPLLKQMLDKEMIYVDKIVDQRKYYQITEYGSYVLDSKKKDFEPIIKHSINFFSNLYHELYR